VNEYLNNFIPFWKVFTYSVNKGVYLMEDVRNLLQTLNRKYSLLQKKSCRIEGESISLVHSYILYEIEKHYQPSMQQVADQLGIDITTFSRQIQTLIKAGLVKKNANPKDKRIYFLSLTERGKQISAEIDSQIKTNLETIFSQLSDFERDTVIHSLKIINKAMSEPMNQINKASNLENRY
jgi:DNA-binding MarR family transcriptional regulator